MQTPTLAMLVNRQEQIAGFQKQKYWNVHLNLDDVDLMREKIFDEEEAQKILEECLNEEARITSCESKEKSVAPPHLYDLTTLQREANRYFGYTAQETLNFTQNIICNICGRYGRHNVFMTYIVLSLFFIPCFKWNKHYYVQTNCCGTVYELDSEIGKAIARGEQ